jgi:hypothetical protein
MAGTLVITTLSDGTNSTSATNCIQGSAKAWVSYNASTPAIKASYNVSSVTFSSAGQYIVNMTNAMADTNYAINVTFGNASNSTYSTGAYASSSSAANVYCYAGAFQTTSSVAVSIFR